MDVGGSLCWGVMVFAGIALIVTVVFVLRPVSTTRSQTERDYRDWDD